MFQCYRHSVEESDCYRDCPDWIDEPTDFKHGADDGDNEESKNVMWLCHVLESTYHKKKQEGVNIELLHIYFSRVAAPWF